MSFRVGAVEVGGPRLFLIAGPCVLEGEEHALGLAKSIAAIAGRLGVPYLFKASFDKANRTSIRSFRGPGLEEGARVLRAVALATGLPVLTDVHTPDQCGRVSDLLGADVEAVLQIPAFLCRQTDLLIAAAETGRAVNVKKGQFVAPADMRHAVEKVREAGGARVCLTERGASFGYNDLVVDMRGLPVMRAMAPVIFDATHSVQQPSAAGGVSGGQPEFIPVLARAAVAAGVDGVFLEVHEDPACAKSDGGECAAAGSAGGCAGGVAAGACGGCGNTAHRLQEPDSAGKHSGRRSYWGQWSAAGWAAWASAPDSDPVECRD